jgi:ATP-dependent helicase HepA
MMDDLLQASARAISEWLETRLPSLSENWWAEHVLGRLTFQQQRFAEQRRIQSLSSLDLAAVLRVLDQNWSELAAVEPLPREARNWVKELQSVRNRWAHAPVGGVGPSDAFRDADTLDRLLSVVGASKALLVRFSQFSRSR